MTACNALIKSLKDGKNDKKIDKDYLMGRFDAIPIIDIYDEIDMEI